MTAATFKQILAQNLLLSAREMGLINLYSCKITTKNILPDLMKNDLMKMSLMFKNGLYRVQI
ncbi:hypothetical protein HERIO_2525 [Hepatospora eriocheir]|uniref:Uncharacterized protein n=1 Tax=Hepatospora eriocheir TaxID=1081669 RepID=A0A1X0Q6Q3_9MICR|nr:hypothetical protein HERIO_2525 [Hepatospora eriocheir]